MNPNDTQRETAALASRVLVAEDSAVNRRLLQLLLHELGYVADVVRDGRDAVRATGEIEYAVVLMDDQMPDLDGCAAAEAIRARERHTLGHTPIIALTATDTPEARAACLAAGMDDFLAKPVDREQLRTALQRWTTRGPGRAQPLHAAPAIDRTETLAQFGNRVELLVEIVAVFVAEYPQLLAAVRTAAAAADSTALERAAHKLAGAVGNFRAVAAYEATRHLQQVARARRFDAVPAALATTERELARLLPELQGLGRPS